MMMMMTSRPSSALSLLLISLVVVSCLLSNSCTFAFVSPSCGYYSSKATTTTQWTQQSHKLYRLSTATSSSSSPLLMLDSFKKKLDEAKGSLNLGNPKDLFKFGGGGGGSSGKSALKNVMSSEQADTIMSYIEGPKIFQIHSVLAGFFGLFLLFGGQLITPDQLAQDAYRSWAAFVLAVSYITWNAPSLDLKSQRVIAQAYCGMCALAAATQLYTFTFFYHSNVGDLSYIFSALFVFAPLSAAYIASGTMFTKPPASPAAPSAASSTKEE